MADQLELVLYSSSFCGACDATRERLRIVTDAVGSDRVTWREINVAADPARADEVGVDVTPMVLILRADGTEAMRAGGVPTIENLLGAIATHLP